MEEQPKDRAQGKKYYHHAEDTSAIQQTACVKHDQTHFQYQHQETQTKKTDCRKINDDVEGEKRLHASDTVDLSHPCINNNGNRHTINASVKQKTAQKLHTFVPKVSSTSLDHNKSMDTKYGKEKALDLNHHDGQPLEKRDSALLANGVYCGFITNGYSSKQPQDNDGSGSEGGYTTPKKCKARCVGIKSTENVNRDQERDMQQDNATQESASLNADSEEKGVNSRLEAIRAAYKAESQTVVRRAGASETPVSESPRKNSDGKTVGTFGKKFEERHKAKRSSASKEDPWTLFKPPPVFPVDNSSAKIVPKISYASKVKENLNKVGQAGGETLLPPVRLSQVPMSAMKTITSASFTNGPVSGTGASCPSVGTFFAPAASRIPPAPCLPSSGEIVATPPDSNCSSAPRPVDGDAYELRKCTRLIYPLNMQPMLPSARQPDPPAAQTNQKALGDIFQNQWGLSFINEPNLDPDAGSGRSAAEEKTTVAPPQGEAPAAVVAQAAQPRLAASPSVSEPLAPAQEPEKRTSNASKACAPARALVEEEEEEEEEEEVAAKPHLCDQESEAKTPGSTVSSSNKESIAKPGCGPLPALSFGLSKEQMQPGDLDGLCSWGMFDAKAAVNYHTKEMEFVLNLQKQDPKRIVVYDGTKHGPDQ